MNFSKSGRTKYFLLRYNTFKVFETLKMHPYWIYDQEMA